MTHPIPRGQRIDVVALAGLQAGKDYVIENRTVTPGWLARRDAPVANPAEVNGGHYLDRVGNVYSTRTFSPDAGEAWYVYSDFGDMEIEIADAL